MSGNWLEKKTDTELLALALTGQEATETHAVAIEAMLAAAGDLGSVYHAMNEDADAAPDQDMVIFRIQRRLEIAAELMRRDDEAKRRRPRPVAVPPIKPEPGPFAGGPAS